MRPRLLASVALLLISAAGQLRAQVHPPGPNLNPSIFIISPTGNLHVTTRTPLIDLRFCKNANGAVLDNSTRQILLNGVDKTSSFHDVSGDPGNKCQNGLGSSNRFDTTSTVALRSGADTLSATICDDSERCTTMSWVLTYDSLVQKAPIVALRNYNPDNRDRGMCLTIGAGEAAALSCGDLIVTHSLPAYSTLNRPRVITLIHNSATADPIPVVAVSVAESAGTAQPSSLLARLRVDGNSSPIASATYSSWASPGVHQVALGFHATGLSTGIHTFSMEVENDYPAVDSASVSGEFIVVNRSTSRFGFGWWVEGVEQLALHQSSNRILWVGGDGSAAVYNQVSGSTTRWARAPGAYRDTLVLAVGTDTTYTRTLRHGVQVTFDRVGHHIQTRNRAGNTTTFYWSSINALAKLDSISAAPGGASATFRFSYNGSDSTLYYVSDPASGRLMTVIMSAGEIIEIRDPDYLTSGASTLFTSDGFSKIVSRTTRRGFTTNYYYSAGLHVDSVRVPLDSRTAISRASWWGEHGLVVGAGTGSHASTDTVQSFTKYYGPRFFISVGDTAEFWIDRWGAPIRTVNPVGAVTTIVRGDTAVPALPTRVTRADGAIGMMTWTNRGNLNVLADSTAHLGVAGLPTVRTTWNYSTNPSDSTLDSPTSVNNPDGTTTTFAYNGMGLPRKAVDPSGHVTVFNYSTATQSAELVTSVVDSNVAVFDSGVSGETVASLRTAFGYDTLGNLIRDTTPLGHVRKLTRDLYTRVTELTDPAGHRTTYAYDLLNRITDTYVHVEDTPADSGFSAPLHTIYKWAVDVLDSVIDPRGVSRHWTYDDADNRITERTRGDSAATWFVGVDGQPDSVITPFFSGSSGRIRLYYDAAGRLTKRKWPAWAGGYAVVPADSEMFAYDSLDRMTHGADVYRTITRAYYGTGAIRVDSLSTDLGGDVNRHEYHYDAGGRRTWMLVGTVGNNSQSDSVFYRYNGTTGLLSLIGVRWRGRTSKDSVGFAWDSLGRRRKLTYFGFGNSTLFFSYDRDGVRRLLCGHGGPGHVFGMTIWAVSVDADGLSTHLDGHLAPAGYSLCSTGGGVNFDYTNTFDKRHELRTQRNFGTAQRGYAYDSSGNRVRSSGPGGDTVLMYWGGTDRLRKVWDASLPADSTGYQYFWDGGRSIETPAHTVIGTREYVYDGLGRARGMIVDGGGNPNDTVFGCFFDALGRMVRSCEYANSGFLGYDGDNVDRTGFDDNIIFGWTFVSGPGLDDPILGYNADKGGRIAFMTDGEGRQWVVGDSLGQDFTQSLNYSSGVQFSGGVTSSTTFNAGRFTSANMPGISFFRNRFYDQATGQFTQEDPIGLAGGLNTYAYAGSNPVSFSDPFGLCPPEHPETTADCPIGSQAGQEATEYWANMAANGSSSVERGAGVVMGHLAALWTPETAEKTGMTLVGAAAGSVAQTASRIPALRSVLNGLNVGSSDGTMLSMKFNPGERSVALIRGGERVLDVGVHQIGESILGAGRQVPHMVMPAARAAAGEALHTITGLIGGIRFIN